MKIEIELSDEFLRKAAESAVQQNIGISKDLYGKTIFSSDFATNLQRLMAAEIKEQLGQVDFFAVIHAAVAKLAQPTVEEAVEVEMKAAAKKAVRAALKERTV